MAAPRVAADRHQLLGVPAYVPLAQIEATVTDTVRWLKAHKVDVVLVGLQFVQPMAQDEHYKAVRALVRHFKVVTLLNFRFAYGSGLNRVIRISA